MKLLLKFLLALTAFATPAFASSKAPVILTGKVLSGAGPAAVPIAGAAVIVFQLQTDGSKAIAAGISDGGGKFKFTLTLGADGGVVYAVARKGVVELMTMIGTTVPPSIVINEMTTVATAYAMAQVFQNGAVPNAPLPVQAAAGMAENLVSATTGLPSSVMRTSPNANETNAWRSLGTLGNILANCVRNSGAACAALFTLTTPPGGTKPKTTLKAMVNIARDPAANVGPLFALGEPVKAYAPYLVAARFGPAAPDKFMRLDAFTLAIKFNATGRVDGNGKEVCPFGGLGNIAFDTNGYAWITNNVVQGTPYSSNCMVVLKPNGHPSDGTDNTPNSPVLGGGVLGQGFGLGFDPSGNMWSGDFGWGNVFPTDDSGNLAGGVSKFSSSGKVLSPSHGIISNLYRAQGTVSDKQGNIWIASWGNNRVQIFPKGVPNFFPYYEDTNTQPFDIRLDSDGTGWVTYTQTSTASKFTLTKNKLVKQFTVAIGTGNQPKGMAVDSKGNAWVTAGNADAIYVFDKNGNALGVFKGGGIVGPWGVATDSNGIGWVANFGPINAPQTTLKYNVTKLCGATVGKCPAGLKLGDPISPATGFTLPSGGDEVRLHSGVPLYYPLPRKSYKPLMRMTAVQIDMAGNLWATNNWKPAEISDLLLNPGGDALVVFVGLAAPVKPVLYSAPPVSPFN